MVALRGAQEVGINVVGSSMFGINPKINAERTYNMYISDGWLTSFPGFKKIVELQSNENVSVQGRGLFRSIRGRLIIAVVGKSVYKLDPIIGVSFIDTIDTSSGRVFIDENLSGQIAIVDGLNLYIYNRNNNALTKQSVPGSLVPNYVVYHNTYFLIGNGDVSGNGAKWFAFSYATDNTVTETYELALQTKSDYAIAVNRLPGKGNNVIVFGTSVAEIHNNVGGLQGYQRVSTINIDYGCLNVDTIASSDTFVCWLGSNESNAPVIMVFDGSQAIPISSDGINHFLNSLSYPEQSNGFIFRTDTGHLQYVLTFYNEADSTTLMYDFNTKMFFHLSNHCLDYHPARKVIHVNNTSYFVSFDNGCLYELNSKYKTLDENIVNEDNDNYKSYLNRVMPRQRICKSVRLKNAERFRARRVTLTVQQGLDLEHTELANLNRGVDYLIDEDGDQLITETGDQMIGESQIDYLIYQPGIDFSFSKDGGVTYSNEVRNILQYTGHRVNQLTWDRMGTANDFTPKFKFWGKYDYFVGDATLEVTQ